MPLLTGTNDLAIVEALRDSSNPRKTIPVPFLSSDNVHSMIRESGFDMNTLTKAQVQELKCLILDIAGLPRGVQLLITFLCRHQGEEDLVSRARSSIDIFFIDRYSKNNSQDQFERLLIMGILRQRVQRMDAVIPVGKENSGRMDSYGDLEASGLALLSPEGPSFQVVVPMIQVKAYLSCIDDSPLKKYLRPVLNAMYSIKNWSDWEKFNVYLSSCTS